MSQKATKTWCLRLLPVVLFFISFVTYYCSYAFLQSYGGTSKSPTSSKSLCGGWLTQKKWESLNFNISRQTQLFLKLEDFFWREHLSKLALPYGIKGSELLLLKVLAVIANYKVPAHIEKLNDAPVRGYEEDVGNKTTMRLFYPESASYNPGLHNEPGTLMVLVPFKQQDLRWLKEILYDEKRVRKGFWKPPPQIWLGDSSKIRVLDPHYLHQTADRLLQIPLHPKNKQKPVHPTTGILAVFMALNYCDVVHIAGFGYPTSRNQRHPIHYYGYDTMKSMKDSYHDLSHEAEALKRLEDSGAILYLHPHT
ncbi:CMP-N-acetylneuraminate-beta-galactosamide-alpha-2,3-sialyltransferase 4 isoform X3 [Centroberyx gerrardi]